MIATDPPVSEKQRRAMWAAARGKSTLGIPKSVGKEFVGADGINVNTEYDVPYGGGTSKDGKTIYVDKNLPQFLEVGGKKVDIWQSIAHHEAAEIGPMLEGDDYETAHTKHANPAEKAYVEGLGVDWKTYDKAVDALVEKIEREPNPKLPPDLYLKPYGKGCRAIKGDPQIEELHKKAQAQDNLAFDRSVRSFDQDGRLHVALTNISKANVCPYLGREIPNGQALGLDMDRKYMLLRDPAELKKAAPTFNNLPLMSKHVQVSANEPQKDIVVGSTGTDAVFDGTYLKNSLVVWDAEAITGVESRAQKEISCAYYYVADMTPGTHKGVRYDGVMREIRGNHVALVAAGRAGPDVMVGDSKLEVNMAKKPLSGKAAFMKGALTVYLQPRLAADMDIDLDTILADVASDNWKQQKDIIAAAVTKAVQGKLATDETVDIANLFDLLTGDAKPPAEDDWTAEDEVTYQKMTKRRKAKDKGEWHEDRHERDKKGEFATTDTPPPFEGKPKEPTMTTAKDDKTAEDTKVETVSKAAMDEAVAKAAQDAEKGAIAKVRAIVEAEKIVRPYVGEIAAQDSAEAVYKTALETMGVKIEGIHHSAYRAVLEAQPKPGAEIIRPVFDSKAATDFGTKYPDIGRVRQL